jgi:hypothetical protein
MRALETVDGWVSGFLLGDVFSGGFSESGGGLFPSRMSSVTKEKSRECKCGGSNISAKRQRRWRRK